MSYIMNLKRFGNVITVGSLFLKNFFKKSNLNNEIFRYNFNWISVLIFVGIIHYCFLYTVYFWQFIPILLIFLLIPQSPSFEDRVSITLWDLVFFCFIFFCTIAVCYKTLHLPLVADGHFLENRYIEILISIFNIFLKNYANSNTYIQGFQFRYLLQMCNIIICCSIFILFFIYTKLNHKLRTFYILLILIVFFKIKNLMILDFGYAVHNFRLTPLFLFGNFSLSPFAIRLSYIFFLCLFQVFLFRIMKRSMANNLILSLISITILTHPLIFKECVVLCDPAAWSFVIFLYTIFSIGLCDERKINYFRAFSMISICQLMRPSAFMAYLPFALLILYQHYLENNKKISYKVCKNFFIQQVRHLIPFLLILISLYHCIFITTGSNEISEHTLRTANLPIDIDVFGRIKAYFVRKIFYFVWLNLHFLYCVFCVYIFFNLKNIFNRFIFLLFFLLLWISFILANPNTWGASKHIIELILPFAFFGLFLVIRSLYIADHKRIIYFLLCFLLAINLINICSISFNNKKPLSAMLDILTSSKTYTPYSVMRSNDKFLKYIKEKNLTNSAFLNYPLYGYAKFILNGYTYKQYNEFISNQNKFCSMFDINENTEKAINGHVCQYIYPYTMFSQMLNNKKSNIKIFALTEYNFGSAYGVHNDFVKQMKRMGWIENINLSNRLFLVMESGKN